MIYCCSAIIMEALLCPEKKQRFQKQNDRRQQKNNRSQLNAKSCRFVLTDVDANGRLRYANIFEWLAQALPCYNVSEPKAPLALNEKHNKTWLPSIKRMENLWAEDLPKMFPIRLLYTHLYGSGMTDCQQNKFMSASLRPDPAPHSIQTLHCGRQIAFGGGNAAAVTTCENSLRQEIFSVYAVYDISFTDIAAKLRDTG